MEAEGGKRAPPRAVLDPSKLMSLLSYCHHQIDPHFVLPDGPQELPHGHPDLHDAARKL